ncbi:glycerol dehydratase reactivase beta/small subunit family protein [Aminiphilus circumscriptus]|jgi:hypothetical protein|uniref:glycerol dehydratase reactivase beta/small subunit family protein n=1 Tax=Aminiphilus circumscriptus TaxID=290732 RepID=UPI000478592C|nr:glycerol dehydratase reactivase beta/small subunit family protein [Aminiphilus circumscriptus]
MASWCGHIGESPSERPAVVLLFSPSLDPDIAIMVGAGSEEEGVPLVWDTMKGTAEVISRQAALRSRLEVGVGITSDACAITLVKHTQGPYILRQGPGSFGASEKKALKKTLRWLGGAAACLAKGQPLPDERKEESLPHSAETETRKTTATIEREKPPQGNPFPQDLLRRNAAGDDAGQRETSAPSEDEMVRRLVALVLETLNKAP